MKSEMKSLWSVNCSGEVLCLMTKLLSSYVCCFPEYSWRILCCRFFFYSKYLLMWIFHHSICSCSKLVLHHREGIARCSQRVRTRDYFWNWVESSLCYSYCHNRDIYYHNEAIDYIATSTLADPQLFTLYVMLRYISPFLLKGIVVHVYFPCLTALN